MIKVTVSGVTQGEILQELEEHFGEQRYYLHNKIGGINWSISRKDNGYELSIPNQSEPFASYLILKYTK